MIKNLRSIIQEKLPLDLRVQIELLSRRRDISNEEKHQELIKLLQTFKIEDVVKLGPGTNRYAFKLGGFVIKVATDHDGKIDNLKEFKMAKRLFPYVTKIYEVSENGTLLVAEYIQPFTEYAEMCKYAEKIRKILTELSTVYLIGDVGLTPKNYSNWGLRIGTEDPVCLDFAYVYEVSSELFICRHCNTNSMLVPNRDFTELICPNKGCNHHYKFEDIRARIGNDIHNHEIGDLAKEGYRVTESDVATELDDSRSNYLARKKEKEKTPVKPVTQEVVYEPFVMEHPPRYYIDNKEDLEMSNFETKPGQIGESDQKFKFSNGMVVRAVAAIKPENFSGKIVPATVYNVTPDDKFPIEEIEVPAVAPIQKPQSKIGEVAFTGIMDPAEDMRSGIQMVDPVDEIPGLGRDMPTAYVMDESMTPTDDIKPIVPDEVTPAPIYQATATVKEVIVPPTEVIPTPVVTETPAPVRFNTNFLNNMEKAISKLSNRIGNHMHVIDALDIVRGNIRDRKMYPETFYKSIQNAVFRSLILFCNFEEKDVPNQNGNGVHKVFTPPETIEGMPYEETMVFISRFWNNRDINCMEDPEDIMIAYRDRFYDYCGIQREFIDLLVVRIIEKLPIDQNGAIKIAKVIADNWCVSEDEESVAEPIVETPPPAPVKNAIVIEDGRQATVIPRPSCVPEQPKEFFVGTYQMNSSEDVATPIEVAQNPVEMCNTDDEEEEGEERVEYPFSVEIFYEDDFDIIKINSDEAFGPVSIPFYTKLEDVKTDVAKSPSFVDDRNGVWDWLIHMVPDMMFVTKDPDKWLAINEDPTEINHTHIVIMDIRGDKYVMGIFCMLGIFIVDDEGESHPTIDPDILAKINKIVRDDIGYSSVSHLRRSLSMAELIRDEEYISSLLAEDEDYDDGDLNEDSDHVEEGVSPEVDSEETEQERAAIKALLGGNSDIEEDFVIPEVVPVVVQPEAPKQDAPATPIESAPGVFTPIRRRFS